MFFEYLTPAGQGAKTFARRHGHAIVAAQIRSGLFAFEYSGYGLFSESGTKSRHIGAITALRQTYFSGAG
jgi:hypothetical protein